MKIFFLVAIFALPFQNIFGQQNDEILISGSFYGQTRNIILQQVARDYKLTLDYDKTWLPGGLFPGKTFKNVPISSFLDQLLGSGLHYRVVEERVIIRPNGTRIDYVAPSYERKSDFTLTGKVVDAESMESLPFAQVLVEGTNRGTATNVDGYFTLFNVPADTSVIILSYVGYKLKKVFLSPKLVSKGLAVEMESRAVQLEEVEIMGEHEELMRMASNTGKISMSPKKIEQLPDIGEKDVFRSFQLLPGISGSNEASSGLYVRGGTPDQNLILYDGFTVYHVDHLYGMFSSFNANALKDVKLSKGGFEAKYGGRLSSVMEVTGKDGNQNEFNAGGSISLMSFNAFMEFPMSEKWTAFFTARRSFQSNFYQGIFNQFNDNTNQSTSGEMQGRVKRFAQQTQPSTYFYDLNGKVTYRSTAGDILSWSIYNGQDNLDNSRDMSRSFGGASLSSEINDLTSWGNWGTSLKWSRKWSQKLYSNYLVSYSRYYSKRDMTRSGSRVQDDEVIEFKNGQYENNFMHDFSLKLDNEYQLNEIHKLGFGLQSTYYLNDYEFTMNDTLIIQDRYDSQTQTSLYLQDDISLSGLISLKPGIRGTWYTGTNKAYLEPRLQANINFTERLRLKGAWGIYYQFANRIIRNDLQSGSRDFWVLADDVDIPVGRATHYIAGLEYETPSYLVSAEAFYKPMTGLSEYSYLMVSGFQTFDYDEFFYEGTGTSKGVELLLQKKSGNYAGWLSYTLSDVTYDFPELSDQPFPANHDVSHEFNWVNTYKYKKWVFALTWIFATGKPYTAPSGGYELITPDGTTEDFITIGEKNSLRLPDYHRLDLSATYNFDFGGKMHGSLGASLFNVYNRQNVWYKEFEIIDNYLIETDVNLLSITPNVTFTIKLK
nr:TonB-dependent receptor [Bacteroidota bacterium]